MLVKGYLTATTGSPLCGARIQIVNLDSDAVIGSAITGEFGFFQFDLRNTKIDSGSLIIRSFDAEHRILAQSRSFQFKRGARCTFMLKVPKRKSLSFKPMSQPLARLKGSLIEDSALNLIDSALKQLIPNDPLLFKRIKGTILHNLPPIARYQSLLGDAWGVLDGDAYALGRFRKTLEHLSQEFDRCFQAAPLINQSRYTSPLSNLAQAIFNGTSFTPHPNTLVRNHPSLFSQDGLAAVYLATFITATTKSDLANLVKGLDFGLSGHRKLNRVLEASIDFLNGAPPENMYDALPPFGDEFPPPDIPPINGEKPPDPDDLWELFGPDLSVIHPMECIWESGTLMNLYEDRDVTYKITSITPDNACAGQEVIIRGENFGDLQCPVWFSHCAGICLVTPISWTNNEIKAVVPPEATPGLLGLRIPSFSHEICDRIAIVHEIGEPLEFHGGKAFVHLVTVNGSSGNVCILPNQTNVLAWSACPNDFAKVDISIKRGFIFLVNLTNQPAQGTLTFDSPNVTVETTLTVTVNAYVPSGICGVDTYQRDLLVGEPATLKIEGMEITQGIQTFDLTGSNCNTVNTISGKDTIVRVYVSSDRGGFSNDRTSGVTGILWFDFTPLYPINGITPNSSSGNPFITARKLEDIRRDSTDHTLNFRIPASLASGFRHLFAEVYAPEQCESPRAHYEMTWYWNYNTALPVRFVRIKDINKTAGTNTRPTESQARFTIKRAFDLFPSPTTDIGPAFIPTFNTKRRIDTDRGLGRLLDDLDDMHKCSDWEWLWDWTGMTECPEEDNSKWVGMTAPFNRGMAKTGGDTCVTAMYQTSDGQACRLRIKTAHELGHTLGFLHVDRGCGTDNPDGDFYNHPNNGDLDEIAFDPFWNQVVSPPVQDFMSYGCTRWVSEDSWPRLSDDIIDFSGT